ncbi:GGDEF domain-containing protein [Thalassomonas actiniarum]|uniref:diguanylate cyclase n=1 Tax=Thalassomonas actiniarum TaxID=485447 RepID=A0AAE9YQ87_9GAMM|nr:diguanylate cyclase [Thalassomonas actiniarum]WDD98253.1 diguanylate cyclase [Thalassomonas actiniarum]
MKTILNILDECTSSFVISVCTLTVVFILLIAIYFNNISIFEPLFLLPIVVLSWYGGRTAGLTLAALVVTFTFLINALSIEPLPLSLKSVIYISLRFIVYSVLAVLIINFRDAHNEESAMASTDNLTGILNSRGFSIELANEILRSIRYKHIFSLSYIDIDNFKEINDSIGHQEGDKLLIAVSKCLVSSLRKTDIVARLGGDEFAVIFPETGQPEVKRAFASASKTLEYQMLKKGWNVSFSVGIVTFEMLPMDIKEAIKIADDLMYTVKKNKKNDVAFQVWQGKSHNGQ